MSCPDSLDVLALVLMRCLIRVQLVEHDKERRPSGSLITNI